LKKTIYSIPLQYLQIILDYVQS